MAKSRDQTQAEHVVLNEERHLDEDGRPNLGARVMRFSPVADRLDCDILSFDRQGSPRFIKVCVHDGPAGRIKFEADAMQEVGRELGPTHYLYYLESLHTSRPTISIFQDPFHNSGFGIQRGYAVEADNAASMHLVGGRWISTPRNSDAGE